MRGVSRSDDVRRDRVTTERAAGESAVTIPVGRFDAVIFDLDGVVTDTASVHLQAWTRMFDEFLASRPPHPGENHSPFTHDDYRRLIDGRPRDDGTAAFLHERGISLPYGHPDDAEGEETIFGLGNRKNAYVHQRLSDGVRAFPSTISLVRQLQAAGVATAVFSASRNCAAVLAAAGLSELFPVRVDGIVAADLKLPGKPDPAVLLESVRRLGAAPGRSVVVEDAEAGVEAGRRGGFGMIIGVSRAGNAAGLRLHGADVVVSDLSEVHVVSAGPSATASGGRR